MQSPTRILGALVATAAVMAAPSDVNAQVNQSAPACTAEVLPAEIAAGESAVRLTVALSSNVGDVASIEAPEGSGIAVAAPGDLPRIPLATEEPLPIMRGTEDNTWTVWVNTSMSEPGTHEVTFIGQDGRCTADLTVSGGSAGSAPAPN
jgi:hypothetical protein